MKKTLLTLGLVLVLAVGGAASASAALPVIDGLLTPDVSEWAFDPTYEYYLDISDPQEGAHTDPYNIERVILFQELGNALASNDGVYLMVKTYGTPSLRDLNDAGQNAKVELIGDFNGSGSVDNAIFPFPPDVQLIIDNPFFGGDPIGSDRVIFCSGAIVCDAGTGVKIWDGGPTGFTPPGFLYDRDADAIEFFFPTTSLGTPPNTPFPSAFKGTVNYSDGAGAADDMAMGQNLIPEPTSMFLLGSGLLGLMGFKRFRINK